MDAYPQQAFGARLRSRRLAGYAASLLLLIGAVHLVASLIFYHAIDRQTLREDHARRVAELLVVSDRVRAMAPDRVSQIMTSRHLEVRLAGTPSVPRSGSEEEIADIAAHILVWEPGLAGRHILLALEQGSEGNRDLVGSMPLADGTWLNFRSRDISTSWPIALRATAMSLLTTLFCVGAGLLGLRFLTTPLRTLSDAADAIAQGQHVPVRESGAADLRSLARSINDMQAGISGLAEDQARSFEAISHDLRTPLARLKIAADYVEDSDIARLVGSSADEMEAMLMSLQHYLHAQHLAAEPEPVDLAAAVRDVIAAFDGQATLCAPIDAETLSYRLPLLLALRPLVENAVQYGGHAQLSLEKAGEDWQIRIQDRGPGIAEDYFGPILDPFFRIDEARARDTAGFGLGIPTAYSLLRRFGGALTFANAREGGLIVTVTVPRPRALQ